MMHVVDIVGYGDEPGYNIKEIYLAFDKCCNKCLGLGTFLGKMRARKRS